MKNKVYWILYGKEDRELPVVENCENVLLRVFHEESLTEFAMSVENALEDMKKSVPDHYAVISDTKSDIDRKMLNEAFLSNNIIDISELYDKEKVRRQIEWILSDFGMNKIENGKIWFVSDTHFSHGNIIRYCERPWNSGKDSEGNLIVTEEDVEKMNEDLISKWNSVVGKDDKVFHLGDFCLGKNQKESIPKIVSRLNGRISLIMGNHDRNKIGFYYDSGFHRVYDRPILWNEFFILSHSPVQWIRTGGVYANLHGHVHNQELFNHVTKNTYNCCVEVNGYRPVSFEEIKIRMEGSRK